MLYLNLKNYPQVTGFNGIEVLGEITKSLPQNKLDKIIFIAALYDLHAYSSKFPNLKFGSSHIDNLKMGATTGYIPGEALLGLNIEYSLINHSEHRNKDFNNLLSDIKQISETKMKLIVCVENIDEAEQVAKLSPYAIAFEDKNLISSGKSITSEAPEESIKFIKLVSTFSNGSKALLGAGISNAEDVKSGKMMGSDGFLLASAFAKADDKVVKLNELLTNL